MSEWIQAVARTEKPGKVRKNGFIPGVIFGKSLEKSISVKFEEKALKQLLDRNIFNTTLQIKTSSGRKICLLKEIQKDPITGDVLHISLQAVDKNEVVRAKVPVAFQGRDMLHKRQFILDVAKPEIEVSGTLEMLPEYIEVDVADKVLGDKITVGDLVAGTNVKILDAKEDIVAAVTVAAKIEAGLVDEEG